MSSFPVPASSQCVVGLTLEQQQRIEQNRRIAKDKLLSKRKKGPNDTQKSSQQTLVIGSSVSKSMIPPQAKRSAVVHEHCGIPVHSTVSGQSKLLPFSSKPPSSSFSSSSAFCSNLKCNLQSSPITARLQFITGKISCQQLVCSNPLSVGQSTNSGHFSNLTSSSSCSRHSEQALTTSNLEKKIKANFVMLSKVRFKVDVPFDSKVIDIFKKMSTRFYDAKTSTWNFGITDYTILVETVKKECRHVELSLVPMPVISLFQFSQHSSKKRHVAKSRALQGDGGGSVGDRGVKGGGHGNRGADMDWTRIDSKLTSTLMEFQKEGVMFCVQRGGRAMIADDMGLGKTLQAIAVMRYYREDWPLLIVCPSSVRLVWAEAFKRWVPSLSEDAVNVVLSVQDSSTGSLVNIISYDLLVRTIKELKKRKFNAVIADESHFLKNYKTARYKALSPLVKSAKRSLLLSGTPALSRPVELFTQINMLDRNFRTISLTEFGIRYCNGVKSKFGWDLGGASNMLELQLYMEESFMIRRMKDDVLLQLPSKRRQMVLLSPAVMKPKSKEWKEMKVELNRAGTLKGFDCKSAIFPLYEKTGRMKLPAIRDYILDLLEGGRKMIVFGHHKVVLDSICESLKDKSYKHIRIDGRTPAVVRQTSCNQFQHDEDCLIAVLSITSANAGAPVEVPFSIDARRQSGCVVQLVDTSKAALALGLTLTAASTVVFAELFWNPGILVQAEDRAYRIGQHNSLNVHYLVARETADDFIWPMIQMKLDMLCQAGLAREDFSMADCTVLEDQTQKSLFDYFTGEATSEDFAAPSNSGSTEQREFQPAEQTPTSESRDESNTSNWFDNLDEDDFNFMDSNML